MATGNIDNASSPISDKIVIGSLKGNLRIYSPSKDEYKMDDLLFEDNLQFPILQLLIGRFIPNSNLIALAILHPFKLTVYELLSKGNKDNKAAYYVLDKIYEHMLGVDGKHFTGA